MLSNYMLAQARPPMGFRSTIIAHYNCVYTVSFCVYAVTLSTPPNSNSIVLYTYTSGVTLKTVRLVFCWRYHLPYSNKNEHGVN